MKHALTIILLLIAVTSAAQTEEKLNNNDILTMGMGVHYHHWVPSGNLSFINNGPGIGVKGSIGIFNVLMVNAYANMRFDRHTSQPIIYKINDTTRSTKVFSDNSIFVSIDYSAIKKNNFVFYPSFGIGVNTVNLGSATETKRKAILITTGAGVKYRIGSSLETFAEARYNYTGNKDIGGTDLSGSSISVNIGVLLVMPVFETLDQ